MSKHYISRVDQLDAIHLSQEVTRIIRESLLDNLQSLCPSLCVKIQPEIELLIQSALWFSSIGNDRSSFGQQFLLLSYDKQKLTGVRLYLHFFLTVLPKYVKQLGEYREILHAESFQKVIDWGQSAVVLLSVLNFFRFLKTGRRPSIVDYLLRLDYVSLSTSQARRQIGYEYFTRELLWGGFIELIGMLLPIINFRKLQQLVNYATSSDKQQSSGTRKFVCAYCNEKPTLPHHIGCEHLFCYYCLAANIRTDFNFCCPACGQKPKFTKVYEINSR